MSSNSIYLVYKHTSPSGKSYIGLTNNYEDRCYRHQLKSSKCRAFYLAIQKYGWNNFTHEILYNELTLDEANFREQQAINEYGTIAPYGYNLLDGGQSRSPSAETRQKISAALTGRKRKPDTPDMILHKSQRMLGRKASPETKAKLSAMRLGRRQSESQKLAVSRKFIVTSPNGVIHHVINLNQFCKDHSLNVGNMHSVATGKAKHHKGWSCVRDD